MSKEKNIMVVGAHPDDVEFGVGGTVAKHVNNGDKVHMVVMTNTLSIDGTNGKVIRTKSQLEKEVYNSVKILGCETYNCLPFKDLHVPFSFDSISRLESLINKYNISTIYTHWEGDANQDHIATFKTTMSAARYVPNVYCYEQIPIPRLYLNSFCPDYYVNITDTIEKKLNSSKAHISQIKKYKSIGLNIIENLEILSKFRGVQAKCKYAEAFKIIKKVW